MDVRRLQFLVRVIDTGSITRAAAALRIAQPALSQHIRALERSVGTRLLVRSKDGVVPTEAGLIAYRNARMIARQLALAETEVRMSATVPAGKVTLGMAPHSHARRLIQQILLTVSQRHPQITLHISENFDGVLAEHLRMGKMDMALLYETVARPGFRSQPISNETLFLVGKGNLLGSGHASLSASLPMLLPSSAHAIRRLVEAVFSSSRLRPKVVAEIESFDTLAEAVREGLGATVLPQSAAVALASGLGMALRPFGSTPTAVTLMLTTIEDASSSDATRLVQSLVAELAGVTQ